MNKLLLVLATILSVTLTSVASAAPQPVQELDQLDDIWVRGKYTANMVIDAEDRFFALYNKLNKVEAYDVSCGYMYLSKGSMIMNRTCMPRSIAAAAEFHGSFAACSSAGMTSGYTEGASLSVFSPGSCGTPAYMRYPAVPRPEYADNVMRVIYSDPQLLALATKLAGMYGEMATVQKQYVTVKAASKMSKVKVTRGKVTF